AQGFFVTDLDVGQAEGFGVPHLCSYRTPFRVGGPVGEFHQVQGVLDVPVQEFFVIGDVILPTTGHQCGNDGDRGGSQVLRELEVLEVAQAVALVVAPPVGVGRAFLDRADGVLPLERAATFPVGFFVGLVAAGVDQAPAGKAQEVRVQAGDGPGDVGAKPVGMAVEGVLGVQGDHVQGDRAGTTRDHRQLTVVGGGVGGDGGRVLGPLAFFDGEDGLVGQKLTTA